jgi:methylated-DNA-[protein]-cysteine S-methyltransferase
MARQVPAGAHALFDTPLGPCGMAWGAQGICAVQLPEASPEATRQRLLRHAPGCEPKVSAPAPVQAAMDGVVALLSGEMRDLREVPLDLSRLGDFDRRVYAYVRGIGPGQTQTYGEVAEALGSKTLARAVGQALGRNPFAPVVPCHRVLAAGRMGKGAGGFSAEGGVRTKLHMLEIERTQWGAVQQCSLF